MLVVKRNLKNSLFLKSGILNPPRSGKGATIKYRNPKPRPEREIKSYQDTSSGQIKNCPTAEKRPYTFMTALFRILQTIILLYMPLFYSMAHAQDSITAVIGALDVEVELLKTDLGNGREHIIEGIRFNIGEIGGRKIVIAATGVGKVNAAMTTTVLIEHFRPNEVISTGVAGAINPELSTGDVVIATKTAQHDLGTLDEKGATTSRGVKNPIIGSRNPDFFPAAIRLVNIAETAAINLKSSDELRRFQHILKGVIVSGDLFISFTIKKGVFA